MLVFFIILSIVIILNIIIYFSTIKLEIDTLEINNLEKIKINDFNIKIYLEFLSKIKWFKFSISKEKIEKIKKTNLNKLLEKFLNLKIIKKLKNVKFIKKEKVIVKAIKESRITIERLNLNAEIGLENIVILCYLVAILNIIIGISLAKKANSIQEEKYNYVIKPVKTKKMYLQISLNTIINIKISNIIKNIIKYKKLNSSKPPIFHQRKILTKVE